MASRAWLPQEVQSSTSQASVSDPPAGGSSMGPSTPTAGPAPVAGTPTSKGASGTATDLVQEPAKAKFVPAPGYVIRSPSFSYNVLPNANTTSGSAQQSSSSPVIKSNSSGSSAFLQSPVPGLSASAGPLFSYNISHDGGGFPSGQQFQSRMPIPLGHSHGEKSTPSPAASLQPPVPGQSTRPSSFVPGTAAQIMPPPMPSPVGFPKGASSDAANFSFNGNPQLMKKDQSVKSNTTVDVPQETTTVSSASSVPHSVSHSPYTTSNSAPLAPNMGPTTLWMPTAPSFQVHSGLSGTLAIPRAPGITPVTLSSNMTVPSAPVNSSSALLRPIMPTAPGPPNAALQHQIYPSYPSVPPIAAPPQGLWLQPPQISGLPRAPLLSYPAAFPGSFPLPTHSMPLPSVPLPDDSQPPGVAPMGPPGGTCTPAASGNQLAIGSGMQPELPPGIDKSKHVNGISIKDGAAVSEQMDAWTAHRTETGAVYYYNALTGESTYEKPALFKGEADKVTAQPTPVSWEKLSSTDWALVTTNDGKRYYYNTKTKLTSWQIPIEVTELRKKQDGDALKEQSMSVPNTNILSEKGSAPISLSVPAVNTGGRDATALRTSVVLGSSSALDMIKKKLQDAGAPASSSPVLALSGAVALELNGSRAVDAAAKGPQCDNSKDKIKDGNGDVNFSESSSDSEDVDSGPTKEECIIQFKEMLKERGVAPFSKWEKELPKIVFDPRFKAIPGYSARRTLFEHYVRTRAEEERKEKRAAQKAAIEGFKQLLEEAKEEINHNTDYQTFKKKWCHDPRFEALDRKERQVLLNERALPLKRAAQEKAQAVRAAAASSFKSMLQDKGDITTNSRWSKVKDSLRNDPRYKSVKHEDREALFNEYISELKSAEEEAERVEKAKWEEEEKLKERERALRKRKEREEQEVERVRSKARRKEAVESYQALLVETIKDSQVSWTESKSKLEKDPQGRASNPYLDQSDLEKLFREHVKILLERCAHEFRTLLAEVINAEAVQEREDGKTAVTSWSTAKRLLKADPRYTKMPRKERESLWRRHVEEMQRRQKLASDQQSEKHTEARSRIPVNSGKYISGSKRTRERR